VATTQEETAVQGRLPDDPAAFIAAAEQGINEYDLEATAGAYAPNATLESVTDGARETFRGADEIREAWAGYLAGMRSTGFSLRKSLVSAAGDVIVNKWESDFRGRTRGGGIETWRFDSDGRVAEHHMYTHFEIRPATDLRQRLRLLVTHPRIAVAFLRATLRS
jgi:ketosteroid isomerase-like protein